MVSAVIEMSGISVSFAGSPALQQASLRLFPGEVHALMGENGAGKSTLIKALTGVYSLDEGEIRIDGDRKRMTGTADAEAAGIAVVYQDTYLCSNLTVGENVMLGHEIRGRAGINWKATHQRASEVLGELALDDLDPRQRLSSLPIAVRQLVAICRGMVTRPRVLVLDEPTSSLDDGEVARLFTVLRKLCTQGVAILFVSHFLEQVYTISDRMTVLRDGEMVGEFLTRELDRSELISTMIGKDIATLRAIGSERRSHREEPTGPAIYRAEGIGRRGVLVPTNIDIHQGEIVGFAGLRGSGRTEFARLLAGAERSDSGTVTLRGQVVTLPSPSAALAHRIAYSSENRRDDGIIEDLSIRKNILLALQAVRGWSRPLSKMEGDALVGDYMESLGIVPGDADMPAKFLSGGNQQKVLLARWLVTRPRVLILDEPTRGIDVSTKVQFQARVAQLAREGVAVVFVSSQLEEVVRLSDRIVVMKDRQKIGEVSNGPGVNVNTIVEMIAGDTEDT
ncbi:sugar ABC transporter ATP-binding protein [Nakamurella antarctica]|uniref:Sugar ABC transporter ATP-binding protein n=1 Tax=Nakamurella antarctica TaxID=1902245 RepID=A0A3G8ZLE6_9ACTN|nr:sugar ABC transporter ATP-binding protein [Nakamurella antarctica]AZI57607.1 sugar ABC transporter ATP-binding protein [Nakamurella antarctica]